MNRRIRRARAGGRHHRALWLTQDHMRRVMLGQQRAIAEAIAPALSPLLREMSDMLRDGAPRVPWTDEAPPMWADAFARIGAGS